MTSQINPNNIDGTYPVAGQPNNTQGFRDNFTAIKTNFSAAATEITDLENNGVFKAALSGTTLDNNMSDNLIYAVKLNDVSYTALQQTSTAGTITLNYSSAQYQTIAPTANISLGFSNWPLAGSYGELFIEVVVTNVSYTMTLPSAVALGTTGIQGYSANIITFAATGTYNFKFSTIDGGTTITIYDLNRPLNYYTNTVNVVATTASTSSTSGALIVAGGVGIGGNLYVNGDIFGNLTIGDFSTGNVYASGYISATGNVTGGNIRTTGLISATGNITAGNILNAGLSSVTGNITGGNIQTAGSVLSSGTGGVGYTTGAGGTVTQSVNRVTGVTLNKTTGNIVLFTAAGNTTPTTFLFTNSTIANSDVLMLNQKSGTNIYNLVVSGIGATGGNANITVWTTGGVTSEAPVINFAVVKGATA